MKILLVEDNPIYSEITSRKLKRHQVTVVGDILSALQALEQDEFNLIICDYFLPDSYEDKGIEQIRKATDAPLIIVSASWVEEKKDKLLFDGYSVVSKAKFDSYEWN